MKIKSLITGEIFHLYTIHEMGFMTYAYTVGSFPECIGGNHGQGENMREEEWKFID